MDRTALKQRAEPAKAGATGGHIIDIYNGIEIVDVRHERHAALAL